MRIDAEIKMNKHRYETAIDLLDKIEINDNVAQEWRDNLVDDIDYLIPFDCVARDIQQWILSTSKYPQPAIAYAAALCVVGTVIGRNICYDGNIKGNVMFVCTAESGEGKDYPFKCSQALLDAVDMSEAKAFKQASGASFIDHLHKNPSTLFYIDEFGNYQDSISGKKASVYATEITGYLTELYTSSSTTFTGKSAITNPAKTIVHPNLSLFGLTTERQIFDGLRTADVANGSVARYSFLFGRSRLMPINIRQDSTPPIDIVERLLTLKNLYPDGKGFFDGVFVPRHINSSHEYNDYKFENVDLFFKKISNDKAKDGYGPMYNRAGVKACQQALLIDQCTDIKVLEWTRNLELKGIELFCKKFNHLGSDNEIERQNKYLVSRIKEAGKKGITNRELTLTTRQVSTMVRKQLIGEMLESGIIFKTDEKVNGGTRITYFWRK